MLLVIACAVLFCLAITGVALISAARASALPGDDNVTMALEGRLARR